MTNDRKPNRPSHTLFLVEGEQDDAVWTEVANTLLYPEISVHKASTDWQRVAIGA